MRSRPGEPSDVEKLIGVAIMEALRESGTPVDGAMHGLFDDKNDVVAGPKSINDIWDIIPFENYLVTAELTPEQIKMIMEEAYASHEGRNLLGFNVSTEGVGYERRIILIKDDNGRPLERGRNYVIAFNTFDSRSAGHRFMKLRALLETPEVNCTLHHVQTRDALIDYFRRHKIVHKIGTTREWPAAA